MTAARFAAALGAKVVLFKARKREHFRTWGRRFLDAVEAENVGLAVALENHKGSSILPA